MTPMRYLKRFLMTFAVAGLVACGGSDPATTTKKIDDLLAKNLPMTAEQEAEFADANQKGRALLQAGNVTESADYLDKA
ncbi:MAG: hypothetical protein OEQ18_09605, partial [Gammaproteobacteria bacterium]|nr:hypothetical protein [Gammaproteobacteria bacterium]